MEHNGVTYLVNDSYRANRRTFLVRTPGTVVFDLDKFFSYAEMFFVLSGATSKRKSGMPRLSRRPSHWGYYWLLGVSTQGIGMWHSTYQTARLLEFLNVDSLEDLVQLVVFSPIFCVFELLEGFLGYKTTCAQVSSIIGQCPADARLTLEILAYSKVSSSWLAAFPAAGAV
jgi:hypothetical protein